MEVERVSSIYVGAEETAVPGVGMDSGAVVHSAGLAQAQAGFPVVKAQTFAAARHGGQLPPALPAHGPATVAQGVAVAVIGDLLPVIGRQQVAPCAVSVAVVYGFRICGIASVVVIRRPGQNVSAVVIAVLPDLARRSVLLPDKLIEGVVRILRGLAAADGGDVSVGVVSIAVVPAVDVVGQFAL